MSKITGLQEQRDRFLAFSFASADLLLEVSKKGEVIYALGAGKSLAGIDPEYLIGYHWLDLFSPKDRPRLSGMHQKAREGERCGPLQVSMDENVCGEHEAIMTAIRMPDNPNFYITVGFVNEIMLKLANIIGEHEEVRLLDKDSFLLAAQDALDMARSVGNEIDMTLVDIPATQELIKRLGPEIWDQFIASLTNLLSLKSIDGHAVAEITEGRYSIIHNTSIDSDTLCNEIESLTKETDPAGEGFEIKGKTVSADLESLSERDATKALIYTINEFERKGTSLTIDTLNTGFKAYVSVNAQKIQQFKTMVEQLNFDFYFHPIVNIENRDLSHYEMLSRFQNEGSTQEWIIFGEDIGMAPEFDIAVCERTINYLLYKASNNRIKFAINLSGQSIQNERFFTTLFAKLSMNQNLADRLIFEITESTNIENLERVNKFITELQKNGFKVCLDDFGTGSGSLQYLQQLHVDFVKIDGSYTRKLSHSSRDQLLIKNICQMCKDLGITVIGEKIETEIEEAELKTAGVTLAQGFLYAHPSAKPTYDPAQIPAKSTVKQHEAS